MALIDEIIVIDVVLDAVVKNPLLHRKFACVAQFVESFTDDKIELNRGNYKDIEPLTTVEQFNCIKTWFTNSGSELTVYNLKSIIDYPQESSSYTFSKKQQQNSNNKEKKSNKQVNPNLEIVEANLILAGLLEVDQLTVYTALKERVEGKQIYFTISDIVNYKEKAKTYEKARNIKLFLDVGMDIPTFSYLAPYSNKLTYNRNNFQSTKYGTLAAKLDTLQDLRASNMGALVYMPSISDGLFINVCGRSGIDLNLDFLIEDIKADVQNEQLNVLLQDNSYTQGTISRLEMAMDKVATYYKENLALKLLDNYTTSSIPYAKQLLEDVNNGIIRGFALKYKGVNEAKEVHNSIEEDLGND